MGWLYSKITVLEWGWMCHHWGQRQFNSGLLEEHMIELNSTVLAHIWTFYFLLADVNNVSFKLLEAHHSSSTCSVTWEGQWKDLISTLSWILMLKSQSNLHSVDIKQMMKRKHASEWNFKGIKSCSLYIFWALGGFHEIWKSCCVCARTLVWLDPAVPCCLSKQRQCLHSAVRVTGLTIPHAACLKSTLSKKALRDPSERQTIIYTMMEKGKHMIFHLTDP